MRDDQVGRDDPRPYSIAVTREGVAVGRDDPIAPNTIPVGRDDPIAPTALAALQASVHRFQM